MGCPHETCFGNTHECSIPFTRSNFCNYVASAASTRTDSASQSTQDKRRNVMWRWSGIGLFLSWIPNGND